MQIVAQKVREKSNSKEKFEVRICLIDLIRLLFHWA